jgi:hypothetical protein
VVSASSAWRAARPLANAAKAAIVPLPDDRDDVVAVVEDDSRHRAAQVALEIFGVL